MGTEATQAMDLERMGAVIARAAANRRAREAVAAADAAVPRDCANRGCRFCLANLCVACIPIKKTCGKRRAVQTGPAAGGVLQTAGMEG